MAIDEWPTDFTVSKKGYADYNEGEAMPSVTDFDLIIIDEAHVVIFWIKKWAM